jgi:hypothetical protein
MSTDPAVREHILDLLRRTTDRRYEGAVKDFPMDAINAYPPQVEYTPWHLLEHLRIGLWDIVEYIRNPNMVPLKHPDDYWPPQNKMADADAWNQSLEGFRAERKALEDLVADPSTDLMAPIPHTPGHTLMREVSLVVGHTAYHLGEFGILRQVMQTWPPGHV